MHSTRRLRLAGLGIYQTERGPEGSISKIDMLMLASNGAEKDV